MRELVGVGELVRLILRRERVALAVWVLILALLPVGVASAFAGLYPTDDLIAEAAAMLGANPAFVGFLGEVHAPTLGGLTAWRSSAPLAVAIGIVSVLTVTRHTRAEEQTGRRELIASTALGRHAPLVAAITVVGAADLLIGGLAAGALIAYGLEPVGALALGAAITACGWVFAGVAAVAAQLAESSRSANGIGLAAVGISFLLRVVGDSATGSRLELLSWVSPIGLAQRVRPFGDERFWVLGVLVAVAVVTVVTAQVLSSRRDLGAGLITARPGPASAARSLSGPVGLAVRLQRGVALSWIVGFGIVGGLIGAITESFVGLIADTPMIAQVIERVGGLGIVADGFQASMLGMLGIVATAHGIQAVLWLRSEELEGRGESVLATGVSRTGWMTGHALVAFSVPVLDLLVAGTAAGVAYAASTGDGGQVGRLAFAALVSVPAAWLMVGLALSLFGWAARITRTAWTLLGVAGLLTLLGRALGLPQWVLDVSPFTHVPPMPGGDLRFAPFGWMLAIGFVLTATGHAGFRRRDVPVG